MSFDPININLVLAVIMGAFGLWLRHLVITQNVTFDSTIASNKDLATRLDASNERGIKLADANAKFQDEIFAQNKKIEILNDKLDRRDAAMIALQEKNHRLDKEILELDKGQFVLNKKFTELGGAYALIETERDALLLRNQALETKITELETALKGVNLRNDDLEAQLLKLRQDVEARWSALEPENNTAMMSQAKASMIQAGDELLETKIP